MNLLNFLNRTSEEICLDCCILSYCHNSGTKAVSLRRFVSLLSDLGKNQLGLNINRERDRSGSYFVGLKIRAVEDDSPLLITGNTQVVIDVCPKLENINVVTRLWTMVINKVTDVMNYVIDETADSEECEECDGKNEKSPQFNDRDKYQTNCNTVIEDEKKKQQTSNEFFKMPSRLVSREDRTQTELDVEDSRSAITVGDKIKIFDCPGHWSWASPFTVEAINGKMVKLEMVSEYVEIDRLSLDKNDTIS